MIVAFRDQFGPERHRKFLYRTDISKQPLLRRLRPHRADVYKRQVEIPGIEIGSTTLKKVVNWLQPSIMAASSMSNGIVSKKPFVIQMENGRLIAV